jgi:hypothetical protein
MLYNISWLFLPILPSAVVLMWGFEFPYAFLKQRILMLKMINLVLKQLDELISVHTTRKMVLQS